LGLDVLRGRAAQRFAIKTSMSSSSAVCSLNPPRDEFLGADDRGSRVVLGEVILSALFRYLGTTQTYPARARDPRSRTRCSATRPRGCRSDVRPDQVTANGLPFTSGQPIRLHTAGDTLRLVADLVSNVRLDSLAVTRDDGAGEVVVVPANYTVAPAFPDTANGGQSRRSSLPRRLSHGARGAYDRVRVHRARSQRARAAYRRAPAARRDPALGRHADQR
jgi:hypothetical protein